MRIFQKMSILILALFAGVSISIASEGGGHLEAYRNYNAALESGDDDAVTKYAEEAWLAAEKELGDNQTTAILAYNYAHWIYEYEPVAAIEPLKRVIEIAGADNDMFGADLPVIMLRYCELFVAEDNKKAVKALRELLIEKETSGLSSSFSAARAWHLIALVELENKKINKVKEYSGYAERHFIEASPERTRNLAEVLILQGVALISGRNRLTTDIEAAYNYFDRAIDLFPAQENVEKFDSLLATALAWHAAAGAAAKSDYELSARTGTRVPPNFANSDGTSKISWLGPKKPRACNLEWKRRKQPVYPDSLAFGGGTLGAVVVGYDLSEDGKVINLRVLAEVPAATKFSETTSRAVSSWQLKEAAPAECRRNILTIYQFYIG